MRSYHQFHLESVGSVWVIQLYNSRLLDPLVSHELTDELLAFIATYHPARIVVDFANVKRCSSDVINMLLQTREQAAAVGSRLVLSGLRPELRQIFVLFQLGFPIVESVVQALELYDCDDATSEEPASGLVRGGDR